MHQIKKISLILTMALLSGCIKPYDPKIDAGAVHKYVVSGRVTDLEGWQQVEVSSASPVESPEYFPVKGCLVTIRDDKGNDFSLQEEVPGIYRVWMDHEQLTRGTAYQVSVVTPGGEELVSGYEKMPAGPQLEPVYYFIEDHPTSDPNRTVRGMQFYVDLDAEGDYSQYYKWEIMETWEYHAAHPLEHYYDGTFHKVDPPDYTNNVCWYTGLVKDIFTISTGSLAHNTYKQYPFHFIDGHTPRLGILYSMLVSQLALTEEAYNYWDQLRINSKGQGGLYEKQPLAIKGNMVNLTNPGNDVLGYFYAASESSVRYFYHDVEGIEVNFYNGCSEDGLGRFGWKEFGPNDYPVYYYFNGGQLRILSSECIDCRRLGGTTVKPDFWPN